MYIFLNKHDKVNFHNYALILFCDQANKQSLLFTTLHTHVFMFSKDM